MFILPATILLNVSSTLHIGNIKIDFEIKVLYFMIKMWIANLSALI